MYPTGEVTPKMVTWGLITCVGCYLGTNHIGYLRNYMKSMDLRADLDYHLSVKGNFSLSTEIAKG